MPKKKLPILYHEARTGKLHSWKIWTEGADIVEEYGSVDGKKTTNRRTAVGKNIGKANETTPEEQALKEAAAKHQKKLDKKYRTTKKGAKETVFLPMLAHDYSKLRKAPEFPMDAQPKLDGVRCFAYLEGDEVKLMSRGGKPYNVAHIAKAVSEFLTPGTVLDGELYIHGTPLQDIRALVTKHREVGHEEYPQGSITLEYWVYDGFHVETTHVTWSTRRFQLEGFFATSDVGPKVKLVLTSTVENEKELFELLEYYTDDEGFEGIVARKDGPYQLGHRSRDLLKLKKFMDDEFTIVGYKEAKGNDKGTVVWECELEDGETFWVRPMGTREQRAKMFKEADSLIGKQLTVKFQQLSKDGVPTGNTVGIGIREYGT